MQTSRIEEHELLRAMVPGLPFDSAVNLALASLFSEKGIKFKSRSAFGFAPPELLPPFEVWRNEAECCWLVRQ